MIQKRSLLIAFALLIFTQEAQLHISDTLKALLLGFLSDPPAREKYPDKNQITYYDKKRRLWAWKNLKSLTYKGATAIDPLSLTYTMFSGATAEAFFHAFDFFYSRKIQYRFQVDERFKNEYLELLEQLNNLTYKTTDSKKQKSEEISDDRSTDWHDIGDQRENDNSCNSEYRIPDSFAATEPIYAGS